MIITVSNQKGGQGKSTTAHAIATGATTLGLKSLAIDLDAQANLSYTMGANINDVGAYELLTGRVKAKDSIQHTHLGDIIAAKVDLSTADTEFKGDMRTDALKDSIQPVLSKYDVIVIDTPPALGTMLLNALNISDKVIIPVTADIWSIQGLYAMSDTINGMREINQRLDVGGILLTKHNTRSLISRNNTEAIYKTASELDLPVYRTTISEGVAIREAQTLRLNPFEYAPNAKPIKEYMQLLTELKLQRR